MALVRRRRKRRKETSSLQILEEAFHLLRTAPASALWTFYIGTVPFVALAMYFVADLSSNNFLERDSVQIAIIMVVAFFWMKTCHARFSAQLYHLITPGHLPERTRWQQFRYLSALWLLQAFHFPMLIVGMFFMIPLGWIIAAWQNMTVLTYTADHRKNALRGLLHHSLRNSHYEWAQNHGILMIIGFVALFLWINFVSACVILAGFGKTFFGTDSLFTINPAAAVFNTTFMTGTALIVYLLVSPILKAVYLLRCFYADSRTTGADLLSRLASCRSRREREALRSGNRLDKVAAMAFFLIVGVSGPARSQEKDGEVPGSGKTATAQVEQSDGDALQTAIRDTMQQKKYQWRLSRRDFEELSEEDQGWVTKQLNNIADSMEAFWNRMRERIREWEEKLKKKQKEQEKKNRGSRDTGYKLPGMEGFSSVVSITLIVVVVGLLGWLIVILVKHYKSNAPVEFEDLEATGPIDLESEDIVASQLPEDEWMKLAREQIARGDTRLAIRALFLASLAHLGENGLLKIARFKSNRDYNRELELRARHRNLLRDAFDENTSLFERAWYGLHVLGDEAVDHFMQNYEKISNDTRAEKAGTTA